MAESEYKVYPGAQGISFNYPFLGSRMSLEQRWSKANRG